MPKALKLKILLVSVFVIMLVTSGLFLFSKKGGDVVPPFLNREKKAIDRECTVTESIGYMYYKNQPQLWEKNNKFGLYVYAENKDFFELAQELVNSNGGDWGYVLIPFNVKDTDSDKWGRVFEQLTNKHLIPVIQLWDIDTSDYKEQTRTAAEFLNRFVWPVRYRYISAYNEVNDAKFWYGSINPEEYAKVLDYTIYVFKNENPDFLIMNGAFNISASTNTTHMDAFEYMKKMNEAVPGIFDKLDAWASHPYPQPNFTGNPNDTGRWSIRAYDDELNYLKNNLGVTKSLPVFITETGWAHAEGEMYNASYLPSTMVAKFFKTAYEGVWLKDDRVRAVMPFTVRYNPPYDHFSWVNRDNVPYLHFDEIKKIKKVAGDPPTLVSSQVSVSKCD